MAGAGFGSVARVGDVLTGQYYNTVAVQSGQVVLKMGYIAVL